MKNENKNAFLYHLFQLKAPLISMLLMITSFGFFLTFQTLYLQAIGIQKIHIGYIHSAFFLGLVLGAWQMHRVMRHVGHVQAMAAFGGVSTCCILIQSMFPSFYVWIAARFFAGLCLSAFYIVVESWLLEKADSHWRGGALGLYMFFLTLGYCLGQQLLVYIPIMGKEAFIVAALFSSASIVPVAFSPARFEKIETYFIRIGPIFKVSPFGSIGCLSSGILISSLYTFMPIYAKEIKYSPEQMVSVFAIGGMLLSYFIGKISDYFDRRKILLLVYLILFTPPFLIWFNLVTNSFALYGMIFLMGGFVFVIYPLSLTQVSDHMSLGRLTQTASTLLLLYGIGSAIGPSLASWYVQIFGGKGIFLVVMTLNFLMVLIGLYVVTRREAIPEEEQREFAPSLQTSTVAYELDPRIED